VKSQSSEKCQMASVRLVRRSGTHAVVLGALSISELGFLQSSLLENLLDDLVLIGGAKLVLQCLLGCTVIGALGSVLMGNEDFEHAHEVSERDALVGLPFLGGGEVIDEDDEVLILALVVGLDLLCFSARHVV